MKTKIFSTEHARVSMKNSNRKKNFKTENYFRRFQKWKIFFQNFKNPDFGGGQKTPFLSPRKYTNLGGLKIPQNRKFALLIGTKIGDFLPQSGCAILQNRDSGKTPFLGVFWGVSKNPYFWRFWGFLRYPWKPPNFWHFRIYDIGFMNTGFQKHEC